MLSPGPAEIYRCKAAECVVEAEQSKWPSMKVLWLDAAESWLALVRLNDLACVSPRPPAAEIRR
jgi:hypothetical protein